MPLFYRSYAYYRPLLNDNVIKQGSIDPSHMLQAGYTAIFLVTLRFTYVQWSQLDEVSVAHHFEELCVNLFIELNVSELCGSTVFVFG